MLDSSKSNLKSDGELAKQGLSLYMTAYYNEMDPFAAAWLRELIKAGHIAPGEVDERSIEDVRPDDLRGFSQCHFFAGIGVWSYALRQAGWPDDREVWTGSCPCQPFSAAGKRGGTADERHLWPALYHLISRLRPPVFFGEQVSSKDGLAWFDVVHTDLEKAGYGCGAFDLCSAGFGAPHIRQRLYFVGSLNLDNPAAKGLPLRTSETILGREARGLDQRPGDAGDIDRGLAYPSSQRERANESRRDCQQTKQLAGTKSRSHDCDNGSVVRTLEHAAGKQMGLSRFARIGREAGVELAHSNRISTGEAHGRDGFGGGCHTDGWLANNNNTEQRSVHGGLVNGFWREAGWIFCRDGKYRPIEPGSPPLATGITNRVGKLRGYGNALTAEVAKGFIESYLEVERERIICTTI